MKFSIIVPTYNEQADIALAMEALVAIDYPNYEIIVVDDCSKDRTVEIVQAFALKDQRIRLLAQSCNSGVASARNIGIRASNADILVILNADVLLPFDFLTKVLPYYNAGNEWVAVNSTVKNMESPFARYIQAGHHYTYFIKKHHYVWTEGFSCTKSAALTVDLFPEKMPGCSGEDVDFGLELEKRFKGARALDICVPHIAPSTAHEFFKQQRGRGSGRTYYYGYMKNYSLSRLIFDTILASAWRVLKMILFVPCWNSFQYARHSPAISDAFRFIPIAYVQETAQLVGLWKGLRFLLVNRI